MHKEGAAPILERGDEEPEMRFARKKLELEETIRVREEFFNDARQNSLNAQKGGKELLVAKSIAQRTLEALDGQIKSLKDDLERLEFERHKN